jgi:tetratricopeptide (TPR) repeat protein
MTGPTEAGTQGQGTTNGAQSAPATTPARVDQHHTAAVTAAARYYERAVAESLAGHPARSARQVSLGLAKLGVGPADEPHGQVAAEDPLALGMVIRLLATLAKAEVEMTGVDRGLATVARAAHWAERSAASDVHGFLNAQEGLILFRGGRFAEALAHFDRAVAAIPDTAGRDKWRVLLNRGALYVETGDVRAARADLARCVQLARRFDITVAEGIALHNLGCLEFIAGDLPLALRLIDEAMKFAGTTQEGVGHLDRSRVLLAAGLQREADEALVVASKALSRDRCWQDVGEVDLTRAESALLAGDVVKARRLAGRARDRFRRHGNGRWRRNAELVLLQADLRHGRPLARLLPYARRLADQFAADGFPLQARTAQLLAAEMEERLGHVAAAVSLAAQAGAAGRSDPIPLRLHTRYVQARLALAHDNPIAARRSVRSGMAELAAYQSQFGGIDVQSASAVHGIRLAELDLRLALRGRAPAAVFAALERGRAASRRLRAVTPPADDEGANLLTELRRTVQSLQSKLSDPSLARDAATDRRRIADLQRALRSRSWQTGGTGHWSRPTSIAALRTLVTEGGRMLVSYASSEGRLVAVAVAGRRQRLFDLGPTDRVRELVTRVRADLDVLASIRISTGILVAARTSLGHNLAELDRILVAPLRPGDRRLVAVPTGVLLPLPWNLLPSLRGRPVEVAPSASTWLRAVSQGPASQPPGVSALAGPGLQQAVEEVMAIGSVWSGSEVLTEADATPVQLRKALSTADVVHVAAHGEHQPESPMFSSLQLAGGPVFAYEFDQTRQIADHVILSACNLGQSTVRTGEESLGLTSVLLHLGTRCVVAGVARVNDGLAAQVMVRYHSRLAGGQDAAAALAEAVESDGPAAAPFVCFGAAWSATPSPAI